MENQNQKTEQKPVIIPRAVSSLDMLNIINDKLDYIISRLQEARK